VGRVLASDAMTLAPRPAAAARLLVPMVLVLLAIPWSARPAAPGTGEAARVQPPAAVRFDGQILFLVRGSVEDLTPRMRATAIEERLRGLASSEEHPGRVRVVEGP
jgi:hypothetical protein